MDRPGHLAFMQPDDAKVLWNTDYGGHNPIFVPTPNTLLASVIAGRRPGKALDVGMARAAIRCSAPHKVGTSPASTLR